MNIIIKILLTIAAYVFCLPFSLADTNLTGEWAVYETHSRSNSQNVINRNPTARGAAASTSK